METETYGPRRYIGVGIQILVETLILFPLSGFVTMDLIFVSEVITHSRSSARAEIKFRSHIMFVFVFPFPNGTREVC